MKKELEIVELELLGIEELESRQEMAIMTAVDVEVGGNSKCTNNSCNTVAGCGSPAPTKEN